MAAMRVMEVTVDKIVYVISVRDRFVATARAMPMAGIATRASMIRRAGREHVLVDVIAMQLMQVTAAAYRIWKQNVLILTPDIDKSTLLDCLG